MKAFIFGNFDDKKAFRVIADDDIVKVKGVRFIFTPKVLNEINSLELPSLVKTEVRQPSLPPKSTSINFSI